MKTKKKILFILIIAIFLLNLFTIKVFAEDEFKITDESKDIYLNGNGYLYTSGGTGTTTWESSDPTVATVDDYGKVTGIKIGTATITATNGTETATCTVNVVYYRLELDLNGDKYFSTINLILEDHPSEKLNAICKDYKNEEVSNPSVTWSSSDSSVVSVDSTGTITALNSGKATITVTAAGVEDTCEVNVPEFTDFSNAKFELKKDRISGAKLEISGITPKEESHYYLIISSNETKPNLENIDDEISLYYDDKSKIFYGTNDKIASCVEQNKDIYVSILEVEKDWNKKIVLYGKKLEKFAEPQYTGVFRYTMVNYEDTQIVTNFTHLASNNRKMKIKIGKITDISILKSIKNNETSAFANLLNFAKNNTGIYDEILDANNNSPFLEYQYYKDNIDKVIKLNGLENGEYYYLYIKTLDENGKYVSNEGITFAQASVFYSGEWFMFFYGDEDFEWENFESSPEPSSTPETPAVPVESIRLNDISIEKGKSIKLIEIIKPENATNKGITWKSSDENIVKVDANGVVSGIAVGKATITATTNDGGKTATCEVTVTEVTAPETPAPDNTTKKEVLPNTGAKMITISIIFVSIASICGYSMYKKYREI